MSDFVELRYDLLERLSRGREKSTYQLTSEEVTLLELDSSTMEAMNLRLLQLYKNFTPSVQLDVVYAGLNLLPEYGGGDLNTRRGKFAAAHRKEIDKAVKFSYQSTETVVIEWEEMGLRTLAGGYITALRLFHLRNGLQLIADDPYLDASTKERLEIILVRSAV